MHIQDAEDRARLRNRLRRIEGQVQGINRMLDDERDCRDVVQQLAAVRSAVHQTSVEVMRVYAGQCLRDPDRETSEEDMIAYLLGALAK